MPTTGFTIVTSITLPESSSTMPELPPPVRMVVASSVPRPSCAPYTNWLPLTIVSIRLRIMRLPADISASAPELL